MALSDVVAGNDRRKSLEAIRDRLAVELEDAEGRDVANLAKELRAVIAELDSLPTSREESPVDQLAEKRSKRRQKASGM